MTAPKVEKEIIIEFSKMVIEHSDSLLKISSGLVIVNILIIVGIHDKTPPYFWVLAVSLIAAVVSVVCGYLANSIVIEHMKEYGNSGEWSSADQAAFCTGLQLLCLLAGFICLLMLVVINPDIIVNALLRFFSSEKGEHN